MKRNVQLMEETKDGVEALKNTIKDVRVNNNLSCHIGNSNGALQAPKVSVSTRHDIYKSRKLCGFACQSVISINYSIWLYVYVLEA